MKQIITANTDLHPGTLGVANGKLVQQTLGYIGNFDLSKSTFFRLTNGAGLAVAPTNVPVVTLSSGQLRKIEFTVEVRNGANLFGGFFLGIAWAGSTPNPSSRLDVYKFYSIDGGVVWVGSVLISNAPLP
jgi:hypothetical protein